MAIASKTGLTLCLVSCLVLVLLTAPEAEGQNVLRRCFDTWSRCSGWSRWGSGRIWATCTQRCRQLGRRGGSCVRTRSNCPLTRWAYQCQCHR